MPLVLAFLIFGCKAAPESYRLPPIQDPTQPVTQGDTGKVYSNVDAAAIDACTFLWKNYPEARKWEMAGCMYQDPQGIKAGLPETKRLVSYCITPRPPPGTLLVGEYHGHLLTEDFSEIDLNTNLKVPSYLCTPSGGVLKYDPITRTRTRLK